MQDDRTAADNPDLLAEHLTKLNLQLRHLLAGGTAVSSAEPTGQALAVVGRLRVAADLLATLDPPSALSRLGRALGDLVTGMGEGPGRLPSHLLTPMNLLADHLGALFDRRDAGEPAASLSRDPRWGAVLAAFLNAGSVLQPLDGIEELMQTWSSRYGDAELSSSQDAAVRQRWSLLRSFGDALFGLDETTAPDGGDAEDPVRALAGRRVLLLLESPFRRAQLRERLRAAGCVVETATSAANLLARVGDPLAPAALLCDNLEPSLHLSAVRRGLAAPDPRTGPALVFVASSGGTPASLRERAKNLGARGTWAEPFRLADLAAILA